MKKTLNSKWLVKILCIFFVVWTRSANCSTSDKDSTEFLSDGSFELGVMDIEVIRFPRYASSIGEKQPKPQRTKNCALTEDFGLQLPKLLEGRYRLDSRTFPLLPTRKYTLSLMIRNIKKQSQVKLEVFSGKWNVVYRHLVKGKSYKGNTRVRTYEATFISSAAPVSRKSGGVPHYFRIWVNASAESCVDALSLKGPVSSFSKPHERRLWIEPDNVMGIYQIAGHNGSAMIRMRDCAHCLLKYKIVDEMNASILAKGVINKKPSLGKAVSENRIILPTDKRGYYKIKVQLTRPDGSMVDVEDRNYVVINPRPGSLPSDRIFGLATEEYRAPMINALITADDLYKLAHAIGVRSARVFSASSPVNVSKDGEHFDFTQANYAVATLTKYLIKPMIELGSQQIFTIPDWQLSGKKNNAINLLKDGALQKTKNLFRKRKKKKYFDLDKYEIYLREVFQNFHAKVAAYEIWNEPGHKLSVDAIMRITRLTRAVQLEIDPGSILVGFSSTSKKDLGKGANPRHNPSFISDINDKGGLKYIDVLSYHSGGAFLFNDKHPDYANQETGYVERLKRLLVSANKPSMPIWDSERGISWRSKHEDMMDYAEGSKRWKYYPKIATTAMDAARKLPMIYASAIAHDVRRLFWFNLDGSGNSIRKTNFRWGMFDILLEPTPQIAVYDAMTEMLGGAKFKNLVNRKDGVQAYYFTRAGQTIILAYNWKGLTEKLKLGSYIDKNIEVFDIMGRSLKLINRTEPNKLSITIGKWPKYIVINS